MRSVTIIFLILSCELGWLNVDQAVLGMALSLLLQLGGTFQWTVRQNAEVVNYMVSVERVSAFCSLPSEAALKLNEDDTLCGWPTHGMIDVSNLTVRYRENLPPSLSGVSCRIDGGERVGIVGRTGSGKSTFVQSLFRILEAECGSILIDGEDISKLGLHKLRREMSVIPQTPTLFSGCSVRENLDPMKYYDDHTIRKALSDVQMITTIDGLAGGLDYMVSEYGSNFSVGQRQLLCLARAVLRKNKILVLGKETVDALMFEKWNTNMAASLNKCPLSSVCLDEPTANVDTRTDTLLQEAVRKSCKGSTIIAVAHRLDTVIDYDRILVIGQGKVLEYGSPAELLSNQDGQFASMVKDCGEGMSQELHRRAFSKVR